MSVKQDVKQIIAEEFMIDIASVTNDCTFADLGADSLDTVELLMHLEEDYEVEIPDEDAETLITVQEVIDYIIEHI